MTNYATKPERDTLAAIAEQLQGINDKLERAIRMTNSIVSGDLPEHSMTPCLYCGSIEWPHVCQPQQPPEPCPQCGQVDCICDTVPGQP